MCSPSPLPSLSLPFYLCRRRVGATPPSSPTTSRSSSSAPPTSPVGVAIGCCNSTRVGIAVFRTPNIFRSCEPSAAGAPGDRGRRAVLSRARVRCSCLPCCPAHTWPGFPRVAGTVTLPEGTEMVMPGDNVTCTFELMCPGEASAAAHAAAAAKGSADCEREPAPATCDCGAAATHQPSCSRSLCPLQLPWSRACGLRSARAAALSAPAWLERSSSKADGFGATGSAARCPPDVTPSLTARPPSLHPTTSHHV